MDLQVDPPVKVLSCEEASASTDIIGSSFVRLVVFHNVLCGIRSSYVLVGICLSLRRDEAPTDV